MEIKVNSSEIKKLDENGKLVSETEKEIVFKNLKESEFQKIFWFGMNVLRKFNSYLYDPDLGEYVFTEDQVFEEPLELQPGMAVKIIDPDAGEIFDNISEGIKHDQEFPEIFGIYKNYALIGFKNDSIRLLITQEKIIPVEHE